MTTELQVRANRANALKSTGPKTEAGRAAVRLNAVRHGLLSSAPVVAGEDAGEHSALCEQLKGELKPVGILEEQIVARMAGALWRLRRLSHIEAGLLTGSVAQAYAEAADAQAKSFTRTEGGIHEMLAGMNDERVVVLDEAAHGAAKAAADEARAARLSDGALLGAAYQSDAAGADALTKLSRYEVMLERSLYRAGEELRRLQEARRIREEAQRLEHGKAHVGAMLRRALNRNDQSSGQDKAE
jgi:hypothetical protein